MSRPLTEDQIERLFLSHWGRYHDAREVAILLYEAGRDGAEEALARAAQRAKQKDLRRKLPEHLKERAACVLLAVADRHGTTVDAILEKRKCGEGRPIAEAMWCLKRSGMSFPEVAIAVHRENHTTAISACARVERRFGEHLSLRTELEAITHASMVPDHPLEAAA